MRILTALVLVLASCGDDTNAASPDAPPIDARSPDASMADGSSDGSSIDGSMIDAPAPDAPTAAVAGTLAVTDVTIVDPAAASLALAGGAISIDFQDLSDGNGGVVLVGTSSINGCVVTQFDPTHLPHGQLDASAITIANSPATEAPPTGLLKTVGPCTFASGRYLCVSHNSTTETVTAVGNNVNAAGTVALVWTGTPFAGQNLAGSYIVINGFTNPHYNSGTSAFPIVGQSGNNTLVVVDPAGTTDTLEAANPLIADTILNGAGPVPGGTTVADFLGTGSVSITKAANNVWPAISTTLDVPGQGWTLSDPGRPNTLPVTGTASALVFGCGNGTPSNPNDDTCGDGSASLLQLMVISGHATRKSLVGLAAFQMPTEVPGTDTWLEFTCAYIGTHSATLTAAAGQAIIDFAPTRVEVRVIEAAGAQLFDGLNSTSVLAGHAIVGHTDR